MNKTDYTIEEFNDSGWKQVKKSGKFFSLCMDENSALHSIWVGENKVHDDFYVVDGDGVVARIDRGVL